MTEYPIEQLTLRQMFTEAERLARGMREHLQQGLLPKAQGLHQLLKRDSAERAAIADVTVRSHVAGLLENGQSTRQLFEKMEELLVEIETSISQSPTDP